MRRASSLGTLELVLPRLLCLRRNREPKIPDHSYGHFGVIPKVLLDDNLRQSLIERGFERLKVFRWDQTAKEVLETYHDAAYKPK